MKIVIGLAILPIFMMAFGFFLFSDFEMAKVYGAILSLCAASIVVGLSATRQYFVVIGAINLMLGIGLCGTAIFLPDVLYPDISDSVGPAIFALFVLWLATPELLIGYLFLRESKRATD